jgi:hypothetical protein
VSPIERARDDDADTETPTRPATRATALLIADAIPASASFTSAITVAVNGATVIESPTANTSSPGRRSRTYDVSSPTRNRSSTPIAASTGPPPMNHLGPSRSASAPKRRESTNITSVTGTVVKPLCRAL